MPSKKQTNDNGFLPGMEEYAPPDERWIWEGQKNERYFDSASLPDAPRKQRNVIETHAIYLLFPDHKTMERGMIALTQGRRKGLAGKTKIVSINSIAPLPDDGSMTFLELWEMLLMNIMPPENEEEDTDEAQAPL